MSKETLVIGVSGCKGSGKSTLMGFLPEILNIKPERVKSLQFADKLKEACSIYTGLPPIFMNEQVLKEANLRDMFQLNMENKSPGKGVVTFDQDNLVFSEDMCKFFAQYFELEMPEIPEAMKPYIGKSFDKTRELMVIMGSEFLRSLDSEVHVNATLSTIGKIRKEGKHDLVMVDGTRFNNEALNLIEAGGLILSVENLEVEKKVFSDKNIHASEKEILEIREYADIVISNNGTDLAEYKKEIKNKLSSLSEKDLSEAA